MVGFSNALGIYLMYALSIKEKKEPALAMQKLIVVASQE